MSAVTPAKLGALAQGSVAILAMHGCGRLGFELQEAIAPASTGSVCAELCDAGESARLDEADAATPLTTPDHLDADLETSEPPVDAGIADVDGGASVAPPCNQGLFCSNFEHPLLDEWDRTPKLNGKAVLESSSVHQGRGALATSASPPAGAALASESGLGPFSTGAFHARAYYFVPSHAPGVSFALLSVAPNPLVPIEGVSLITAAGAFGMTVHGIDGAALHPGSTTVPLDRWFCLELALELHDSAGTATIIVDGVAEQIATGIDTLPAGGINTVSVGIALAAASTSGAKVLVDDVVVDTRPIGCD